MWGSSFEITVLKIANFGSVFFKPIFVCFYCSKTRLHMDAGDAISAKICEVKVEGDFLSALPDACTRCFLKSTQGSSF